MTKKNIQSVLFIEGKAVLRPKRTQDPEWNKLKGNILVGVALVVPLALGVGQYSRRTRLASMIQPVNYKRVR